jgi:hypothetical protein
VSGDREDPDELRRRIAGLERALAVARVRGEQAEKSASRGLLQRLVDGRSEVEGDRRALKDLSAALDRLGGELRGAAASTTSSAVPPAEAAPAELGPRRSVVGRWTRRVLLALALATAAAGAALLIWSASRSGASPSHELPAAPAPPGTDPTGH